jgi:molybdopterin synthase sulfur carrier subunit
MMMRLLYFAWIREKTGKAEEMVELPRNILTVADLVAWLKTRGPEYAEAFCNAEVVRVAIDQRHVKYTASLAGAHEVAFFPPVTGG